MRDAEITETRFSDGHGMVVIDGIRYRPEDAERLHKARQPQDVLVPVTLESASQEPPETTGDNQEAIREAVALGAEVDLTAEPADWDAVAGNYPELKARVEALQLATENQKKGSLLSALRAHFGKA